MSTINQFKIGFGFVWKGFRFFFDHRSLWIYAVIPTAINLLFLIGGIFLLVHYFSDLTLWLFGAKSGGGSNASIWMSILGTLWTIVVYILKSLIFILILFLILIFIFVFSLIITEPFNDLISERVEKLASGEGEIPFSWSYFVKSISKAIIVGLQKAVFFILIPLLILILNLIPVIGTIAYIVLTNVFASFSIGFNFIDYPMSRRLMTFTQRLTFAWGHKKELAGFGCVALIPFFTYFFSAPMVVGGTLLFTEVNSDAP